MKKIIWFILAFVLSFSSRGQTPLDAQLMNQMIRDTTFILTPGVSETNLYYLNKADKPMAVYILHADLKKHKLGLEATTPFNKDTFARQTMMNQMKYENGSNHKVIAGVNAGFFNMKTGDPVEVEIKEGRILKDTVLPHRAFVGVLKNGKVIIGDARLYRKKKKRLVEATGGSNILVEKGREVPQKHNSFSLTRHPRTAVGVINRHEVVFVVVDGRQPDYANGMPLDELAHLMKKLGSKTALNLDGGGSSTLISLDKKTGQWINRNKPSGKRERPVANGWIIVDYQ